MDWTDDLTAAGAERTVDGVMAHDVFVDSLFELADLWTSADPAEDLSAAAAAYRDFLAQALERITVPGGRALLPVDTPRSAILQNHGGSRAGAGAGARAGEPHGAALRLAGTRGDHALRRRGQARSPSPSANRRRPRPTATRADVIDGQHQGV